ncbi:MAG: hypothetical protein V1702_05010 [Candidatus Woesearchaeota archaeon]
MSTPIFSPEAIVTYTETRLFGKNVSPEDVTSINLHNGVLPSKLEHMLASVGGGFDRVLQNNGREPLYYQHGGLHIPQYSGFGRRRRYEQMIDAYLQASNRNTTFRSLEVEGKARKTNHAYDNFAYDFVKKLFEQEPMSDITRVIFGPLNAVAKQAKVLEERPDEYLPSQIVDVNGRKVANLGYVFSDQAGILIDKMLIEYAAIAKERGDKPRIEMFMFGRVGGLREDMQRHDLVFPTGIVDDTDLEDGRVFVYPMHNVLTTGHGFEGLNLNVNAVVNQTFEQLKRGADNGCICVEMETRETVDSVNQGRRRYAGILRIEFGFAGFVSDMPLLGDTIDRELDSDRGEQAALERIIEHIARH